MNCPGCGKAMLTERPHVHATGATPRVPLGVWQACEDRAQSWEDACRQAEAALRNARIVAEYWRDEMMAAGESPLHVCAHPLAMVLAALDGETDPVQMGTPPHEFARRLLAHPASDSEEAGE